MNCHDKSRGLATVVVSENYDLLPFYGFTAPRNYKVHLFYGPQNYKGHLR